MIVDAFQEPNRPVIAKCRAYGFEMHGPLLRVATETGHPCTKCGALGTFTLRDKEDETNEDQPDTQVHCR